LPASDDVAGCLKLPRVDLTAAIVFSSPPRRCSADVATAMMIATAALLASSDSVEALLAGKGGVPAPADELWQLKQKLDEARGLAADAEAKEGRDAGARAWLRDLRYALYVLGDSVDDFRRAAARRHQQGRRSVRALFLPSPGSRDAEQI
jgi:hypothetical protein